MHFSNQDTQRIKSFYQKLLATNNENDPRALNWSNEYTQKLRFLILSQIDNLEGCTILDVGCGLGDLYEFLTRKLKKFHYVGIDIVPEMIANAKQRFPETDFRVFDFSHPLGESFDYVLSSGALSYKIKNHHPIYLGMIQQMFKICKKGAAFNVLNKQKHPDNETYVTYDPTELYEYCADLTDKLILKNDYLDYDFTLYLYK